MPIIVDWYDKAQHIILKTYLETWSLDEIKASTNELTQTVAQTSDRFDVISDFSRATQQAPPIGLLWQWYEGDTDFEMSFPNWGLHIYVGSSSVGKAYFEAGFEQYDVIRRHSRQARTVAEALQLIMADRAQSD